MDNLEQNSQIYLTPCGHCFHEKCVIPWIEKQVEKFIKEKFCAQRDNKEFDNTLGPNCPNCNNQLLKEVQHQENNAIDKIIGVLDSESKMLSES